MLIELLISLILLQSQAMTISEGGIGEYTFCRDARAMDGELIEGDQYDTKIINLGADHWVGIDFNEGGIFRIETNSNNYALKTGICPGSSVTDLYSKYPTISLDLAYGPTFKLPEKEVYFTIDKEFEEVADLEQFLATYGLSELIKQHFGEAKVFSIIVVGSCNK